MSITRATLRTNAKAVAQDPAATAKLLLSEPSDYNVAIDLALDQFRKDKPNRRIVHYTVPASAFRFVLYGTGAIAAMASGLDTWIDGGSTLETVWVGYDIASNANEPVAREDRRQRREPGPLEILELISGSAGAGQILRLEYLAPHVIDENSAALSSILTADQQAIVLLTAYQICSMTARRYVQNTGTSSFQNESVDRRTQSDIMASRAKDLLNRYNELMGKGTGGEAGSNVQPVGVARQLEIDMSRRRSVLWPY